MDFSDSSTFSTASGKDYHYVVLQVTLKEKFLGTGSGNPVSYTHLDVYKRQASLTVPQTIEVLYDLDQQDGEKLPIDALSIEECADILEQEYLN